MAGSSVLTLRLDLKLQQNETDYRAQALEALPSSRPKRFANMLSLTTGKSKRPRRQWAKRTEVISPRMQTCGAH